MGRKSVEQLILDEFNLAFSMEDRAVQNDVLDIRDYTILVEVRNNLGLIIANALKPIFKGFTNPKLTDKQRMKLNIAITNDMAELVFKEEWENIK